MRNRETGHVIELRLALRVFADRGVYPRDHFGRIRACAPGEEVEKALLSELARLGVGRLSHAVGVEKQEVAFAHRRLPRLDLQMVEEAERQAASRQRFDGAVGAPEQRRKVAAAAIFDLAGARVEGGVEQSGEELGGVVVDEDTRSPSGSRRAGPASRAN